MPLDGAKLIYLEEDGGHGETIPAQGRTFKFGYYMNCDVVLEHPNAMGIQCVIDCDAFGRVTIENRCPELPITLNGKILKKLRPLLHNTEICILEKKFLWHYQSRSQSLAGLQSEDVTDFSTPGKQIKKAQQPPNSEPGRRWRRQLQKRLTIHSFTYCIESSQNLQAVEGTIDENKPPNRNKRKTASLVAEQMSVKKPPPTSPIAIDLIDLKTPQIRKKSLTGQRTPLSCCRLSETVITSYSPRETGLRPEKSFAVVQSPAATHAKPQTLSEMSLGPFKQMLSPSAHNYRPSMHLIDLTTPIKRLITASPSRNLLKSALKKNHQKEKQTPQHVNTQANTSTVSVGSSVCSVHTTDDESVIELSDDVSCSPSSILKTPVRANTSKSLMKHAILSSAKKVATSKRLQRPASPQTPCTPKNQQTSNGVRFRSQSTPQRKSLGSFQSPGDNIRPSISMNGRAGKPMVTSTPFRADESTTTVMNTSERTSILHSPYTSLTSAKNKSRNSLMLKQALTRSPRTSSAQKRKSVSFLETKQTPSKSQLKGRKSVSFLDRIENEQSEQSKNPHHTFSIEEDQASVKENVEITATPRKDVTFTPEKEKDLDERDKIDENQTDPQTDSQVETLSSNTTKSPAKADKSLNPNTPETPTTRKNIKRQSIFKPLPGVNSSSKEVKTYVSLTKDKSVAEQLAHPLESIVSQNENELLKESVEEQQTSALQTSSELNKTTPLHQEKPNIKESIISQTPQSSRKRSKVTKSSTSVSKIKPNSNIIEDDDFEGLDAIFKTPQARNLMILGSPKSISLQKSTTDSVALMHSTEFDLSANLDDIFKTPQSEFMTQSAVLPAEVEKTLSPEEAFDILVGRPINIKTYERKTPIKGGELSPRKGPKRSSLPKTDIEEWIDKVNESVEIVEEELDKHLDVEPIAEAVEIQDGLDQEEDEMSYFTSTTQGEFSRDPLTMSSVSGSLNSTTRRRRMRSPTDESVMTIQEHDEEENIDASVLKDPLEVSAPFVKKISLSPNISGIDILDHTSESIFSETLEVSDESEKEELTTIGDSDQTKTCVGESMLDVQISPDKARIDMEKAFENFEKERKLVDGERLVSTPQPIKSVSKSNTRRTMGNQRTLDSYFDVKALKKQRDIEIDFENFVERPSKVLGERLVKTPQHEKPLRRDMRKTMDGVAESSFDLNLAKAEREMELAFKNFEKNPTIFKVRAVQTPDSKKIGRKDHRRTMGTSLVPTSNFDLQAAKAGREMELAFENFKEEPSIQEKRVVQTPGSKKITRKDYRRTMGTSLVPESKLDLQAAKAEREMELAFENFEEEPSIQEKRLVQTPDAKKITHKDHRRTMGTSFVPSSKLDLQAAKTEREMELAFENFEEQPSFQGKRVVQTPDTKKIAHKDHRRTMGTSLVPESKLDLQAAKAEREMELAFENFEEEPSIQEKRVVQTPDSKKITRKDHRRTMGTSLVPESKLDLQAAKAEREMELAFENFEEEPSIQEKRVVQTPDSKKITRKDHRRTMGTSLVPESKLDLQAAKAEREMELAFENFEEEPSIQEKRLVQTPDAKKIAHKDHRRTMGTSLVPASKLDLQAAKAEREMELAFENFEEEPSIQEKRVVQTPDSKKITRKDHRRTMGTSLVPESKLDLQAAKAEREMELAFENFEEEPSIQEKRVVQTPDSKKITRKDHRRTMGTSLVPESKLDLQAAKAEREMELAFENFEEEPSIQEKRVVQTPDSKKITRKDHRRTMGTSLVPESKLDLQAAKAEREMELAFENFEEEPSIQEKRLVQTPDAKKIAHKDHRRTMGTSLVPASKLDLQAAKAEMEMEMAFENFEEEPSIQEKRVVQTPDSKKITRKDHRRTVGTSLVPASKLDLQAAKAEREMELAFENFDEEPSIQEKRLVQTPDAKKIAHKDHRRTMGTSLVPAFKLDVQAAKAEREMELAFENFEVNPTHQEKRIVQTPDTKKIIRRDHRRTMGTSLVPESKLDLQAAKAEREMELAFENFEEEPSIKVKRVVQTPDSKKITRKDHRRTMGTSLVPESKLDLQAAKAEREMELAFENFEEEPSIQEKRVVQTPDSKKITRKDHRRTVGTSLVPVSKLDLQAAKAEREMELAFENFDEEPSIQEKRLVQTPDAKKIAHKDHRRTMGTSLVPAFKLDVQAAKAEREMELAFENFEVNPTHQEKRIVQTPDTKKIIRRDHRRTMGTSLVSASKLDLKAEKAALEMELAFENFEEEPSIQKKRVTQTPDVRKITRKDHRRTMGTSFVPEGKLDIEAAKAELEMEVAFKNFKLDHADKVKRLASTPDVKKRDKATRMSLGYKKEIDHSFDPFALKSEREKEQKRKEFISKKVAIVKPLPMEKESEFEQELVTGNEEENQPEISQPVDGNVELQICNKVVLKPNAPNKQLIPSSAPTTNSRPRRKRQHSVDDQSLVQRWDEEAHGKISFEEAVSSKNSLSRSRRRRQKTIDGVDQLNSQEDEFTTNVQVLKDLTTSDKELSKAKKRNPTQIDDHLDSIEDELIAVVDSEKNQHESAHHTESSGQSDRYQKASGRSQRKRHIILTTEDETAQGDTPEVDFITDVDRTLDETKYIPLTRKKRLQKVSSGNVSPAQSEEPNHLALESIVEEEKKTASPVLEESCDVEGEIKSKPFKSRANQNGASKQDEVSNDGVTNSVPDVGAEVDEIISATPVPSRKRVRGRIAQLNVVAVESNNASSILTDDKDEPDRDKEHQLKVSRTFTVKIKPRECEDTNVFAEENNSMTTTRSDAKDEIPSTPLLTKTRGRRPARKLASAEPNVVPALRRTRRGSVQQDIDVEVVKVENQDEEMVLSTPVLSRSRGRKAALKAEATTTTFTSLSPAQKVSHRRAVEEVEEVLAAVGKDEILQQEANPTLVTDEIQSVKTNVESVSEETEGEIVLAPQKARGRKPGTMSKITESVENRIPGTLQSAEEVPLKIDLKTCIAEENDVQRQALSNKRHRLTNDETQSQREEENSSKAPQNHEEQAENHTEKSELEKVIPTKRRKGAATTKLEPTNLLPENSTKQSRRRRLRQELVVEIESNEVNADEKTSSMEAGIHTTESDVENVIPSKRRKDEELSQVEPTDMSLENATKRNRRRPGHFEVVVKTENQDMEVNNEEKSSQPEVETITEKSHIEKEILSKQPRDATELKQEVKEITKRALRRAGRQDLVASIINTNNEVTSIPQSTEESELENVIPSKRRKRVVALKSEPAELSVEEKLEKYDIESKIETVQSHNPESAAVMKPESANTISTPVRKRGRPAIVKKETLHVESMSDIQTKAKYIETAPLPVPKASRGRGRPAKVKLEPTGTETPDHKGKSDISHGDDEASTDTTPTKNESEIKSTGRPLRGRKVLEKVNSPAKTSKEVLQSAEVVTEKTVTKKPSRGRRVLSTSTPSQVNVKIEPTETESQTKVVRGRRVVMNKDTTLESTSHTEEERHTTPVKTKVTRGRKLVTKDDISEKENVKIEENKTTGRGRRANNRKVDASDARVPSENEEIDKKPSTPEDAETKTTRSRRGVQIKPEPLEDNSQVASEESQPSPALKKSTRARKPAALKSAKDSDDEQSPSESQKKPTRSQKAIEPAKEEEKAIPKRTTRRNLDVASEHNQDTPSKRIRRKPKILLGDEFVQ